MWLMIGRLWNDLNPALIPASQLHQSLRVVSGDTDEVSDVDEGLGLHVFSTLWTSDSIALVDLLNQLLSALQQIIIEKDHFTYGYPLASSNVPGASISTARCMLVARTGVYRLVRSAPSGSTAVGTKSP